MGERDYLAQALLDRLRAEEVAHCRLAEAPGEIAIAVPGRALAAVPGTLARFCRDFDLQLAQLLRLQPAAWVAVIAWSDELGRPRFLSAEICSDSYRGGRLQSIFDQRLPEQKAQVLSGLWEEEPRAAMEQIARF